MGHLELTAKTYFKPQTDNEAQQLARQISLQTGDDFFQVLLTKPIPIIKATFGPYAEYFALVNCFAGFPYERHIEDANTSTIWISSKKITASSFIKTTSIGIVLNKLILPQINSIN
ncbi:hypothetical protein [Legionella sp. WA2022007384]